MVTFSLLLVIIALVLFGLVTFNVASPKINLTALAFFCLTLAMLLGGESFAGIIHR